MPVPDPTPSRNPLSRVFRSTRTAGLVAATEDAISAFRRERKLGKGTLRSTYVAAYRGYVAQGLAYVRVRVIEEPVVPGPAAILTDPELIRSNMRRFVQLPFPGVRLTASLLGSSDRMIADRRGFSTGQFRVGPQNTGWYDYSVVTEPEDPDEKPASARGQVLVPDPEAQAWVISDIDDTVLQTGLSEGFAAVRTTLLGQARTRRAVPGMASLYRSLEAGVPGSGRAAFFYLSTGPWQLYDMLTEFLRVRGFPAGPLFLTDWGPQQRFIARSGVEHKRTTLRRLFTHYPDARFVLIGDSGQQDADTYTGMAQEFPDQVVAIVIVDVGNNDRVPVVQETQTIARSAGIDFMYVADAHEAAVHMERRGLVTPESVDAVAAAVARG